MMRKIRRGALPKLVFGLFLGIVAMGWAHDLEHNWDAHDHSTRTCAACSITILPHTPICSVFLSPRIALGVVLVVISQQCRRIHVVTHPRAPPLGF
ncbi:MAG: hypothetical protein O3A77_04725 [bacterium]|nr:hypothetical protein [bacterium]